MKLTNKDAQRLLGVLRNIDAGGDVKLAAQTRMNIAININRLMPIVAAFETSVQKRTLDMQAGTTVEEQATIKKELMDLIEAEQKYDLVMLKVADLNLNDNPKITGETIASLAPVIPDLAGDQAAA